MQILERETGRNDAFRLERYVKEINKASLRDDLVAYLGEYRFALPKYSYKLTFKSDHLLDPNKKVSLEDMAHKSIGTRLLEGKSTHREIAEKEGIQMLDKKLQIAKKGDTIIWISPPGEKSEGYGDYGFVFYGKVGEGNPPAGGKKDISMTAIRVDGENLGEYNKAFQMLTRIKTYYSNPEQFIANPQVLNDDLPEGYVDAVLGLTLGFRDNLKEKEKFQKVIQVLNPLIEDFTQLANYATLAEKEKAFFSLENYALKLKKDYEKLQRGNIIFSKDIRWEFRLQDIVGDFGYQPPKVAGSCGSTSKDSFTSSNIFNKLSELNSLMSDKYGDREFDCPECGRTNIRRKDKLISNCQHCNSSKVAC